MAAACACCALRPLKKKKESLLPPACSSLHYKPDRYIGRKQPE